MGTSGSDHARPVFSKAALLRAAADPRTRQDDPGPHDPVEPTDPVDPIPVDPTDPTKPIGTKEKNDFSSAGS